MTADPRPSPVFTWLGLGFILASALLVYGGFLAVYHSRQETCVRQQLAQGTQQHLSVWEAVARCRR